MGRQFEDVSSTYGAPMGRQSFGEPPETGIELFRVALVDGAYDDGGAYWGAGEPLWCARAEGYQDFCRAPDFTEAIELLGLEDWQVALSAAYLGEVTNGYFEAMLWAEHCDDPELGETWLDANFSLDDIDTGTWVYGCTICADFIRAAKHLLDVSGLTANQIGNDLWLTRQHHGAGFWARRLGEVGRQLTELAQRYGSVDTHRNDQGLICIAGESTVS